MSLKLNKYAHKYVYLDMPLRPSSRHYREEKVFVR